MCCSLLACPFLLTLFPPITDLPQQAAQIRLLVETLQDPKGSPYTIQWFTPYSLSYLVLGGCWALFGPENSGRLAMLLIVLLWVISIHLIAGQRNRPAALGILASLFVLNHIIYWGFYSFAVGWPAFVLWFYVVGRSDYSKFTRQEAFKWLGCALLLYMSHILWFAAGVAWFILRTIVFRAPVRGALIRSACLAPLIVVTAIWYPMFSGSSMATPPLWATGPLFRLSLSGLTDSTLGGIRGPAELVAFSAVAALLLVGLWQNRKDLRSSVDIELLLAAGMFFAFAQLFPDKFMNTIRFWQRWMPPAAILAVLALPAPSVRPLFRQVAAVAMVGAFCAAVSGAWMNFERKDLSGLQEAIDALPQSPRVLGLDMVKRSEFVRGRPFIQVPAYAQVFRGGTLNFSFAEFSPCLVVYKQFRRAWTGGLEWFPENVKARDLRHFDFALVNGTPRIHSISRAQPQLSPVTNNGRWRLYKIVQPGR